MAAQWPAQASAFHTEADVRNGFLEQPLFDPLRKLTTLREKLVKIGAKIVRHGRYVTFQLAEVAIPRTLFADILRRIDQLRPKPLPT